MTQAVRSWRMAFLTLRDENLTPPPRATVLHLLNHLILSQSDVLIAASGDLPPNEVTSDLILLMELARDISHSEGAEDVNQSFTKLSHLIHGICRCSSLEINSTSWAVLLELFGRMVHVFFDKAKTKSIVIGNAEIKATKQCLESLRCLFGLYQAADLLLENEQLLNFVLQVVTCFQRESVLFPYLSSNPTVYGGTWELLTVAFGMIGEVYSKVGSSLSVDIWQSTIEAHRKVLDICASRSLVSEDNVIAMFYTELLCSLHLVLSETRGYLADHVAGFVAALRIFFRYGLVNKALITNQAINRKIEIGSKSQKPRSGPYRPPHLRKEFVGNQQRKDEECVVFPTQEFITSDSECSDNDVSVADNSAALFAKARLTAIQCIQDLCRVDPKLFTSQWPVLLPSTDILQHRKSETTLMSCLLYDPNLKVRMAAGSAIMTMLDGPSSISLQVAEFKERPKCGSFTALSSSLGHILMQLHTGTLYLIKQETNRRLLVLAFKILVLLISSTPYSRMSPDLLSMVLLSVQSRIHEGFSFQSDRDILLEAAINCLTVALSVSPSSVHVNNMLLGELSTGSLEDNRSSGVFCTLIRYSESSSLISLEAFQALKALAHNYPNTVASCWKQISSVVHGVLSSFSDGHTRMRSAGQTIMAIRERVMIAAIKVLDECLRAISGFRGTEDLSNDKSFDSPFTSDCVKTKAISSAPSYSFNDPMPVEYESKTCLLASECWFEVTVKHMPIIIKHSSAMVRAASVTCFGGLTSSVFFALRKDKQEFIISSLIDAALNDEVASVRSASCRAIGVLACFPQLYDSPEILEKFIHAAEHNALDSLVSVRITASWALANICNSISHSMKLLDGGRDSEKCSQFIPLLFECALRLARDNDKVKANAVRALGNLSRFIPFTSQPLAHGDLEDFTHLRIEHNQAKASKNGIKESSDSLQSGSSGSLDRLEQMVQAFISCVTTGNVKVQWNVCHALNNLFFNKTLKLQHVDWAASIFGILLLLLRDSSNYKIRIQAAAAMAVPGTIYDYGKSYYDVIKTVEHVVENFRSDQTLGPSNFKYLMALEKQLTSTMLHLLCLAAGSDQRVVQDFLVKKATFLEAWMKDLCSSLGDTSNSIDHVDQKRDALYRTIQSLISVFESSDHSNLTRRFERLSNDLR